MTSTTNETTAECRPSHPENCHLLALPPELRNRIYRHAVVEDGDLHMTPCGPGEPTLLRTCNLIREEACSIYYGENKFVLRIQDWNGTMFQCFMEQHAEYAPRPDLRVSDNCRFLLLGFPNWNNMVKWATALYIFDGCIFPALSENENNPNNHFVSGILQMIAAMEDTSRETMHKALNGVYQALRVTDSKWVRAGDRIYR